MKPYTYTCKKLSAFSATKYLEAGLTRFTWSGIIETELKPFQLDLHMVKEIANDKGNYIKGNT